MTFQELLSDPNFQTVVVPLFTALIPVVLGWFLGFLPAELKKAKWDRWLKLVIEAAVLVFVGRLLPEAMAAFNKDDPTSKVIGALYGVVLVILIGMMVADVVQLVRKPSTLTAAEMDEARWQDNRQTLMDKVRVKWIDGVLKKSLYEQARIAVGLEERPEMVGVEWQTAGEEKQVLPPGTRLLDRFANLGGGGTLLVLGEPGAGKTTLLLELAQDLLDATDFRELEQPIPIVLNLSAWGSWKFPDDGTLVFTQWLLEELWEQYQVRKEAGNTWLENEKWTLLLDGLDEVKPQYREACVEALNQFRQKFGNIEIVLCCRITDYQDLNTRLERFQAAVYIQPLTDRQVDEYLTQGRGALVGIAAALESDSSLRDLTNTPLFLWILTLAYRNRPAQELLDLPEEKRVEILFKRYIERMFVQRPLPKSKQNRMLSWLSIVANKMGSDKEFLIEYMQPQNWLISTQMRQVYLLIYYSVSFLVFGLLVGMSCLTIEVPMKIFSGLFLLGLFSHAMPLVISLLNSSPQRFEQEFHVDLVEVLEISKILKKRQEIMELSCKNLLCLFIAGLDYALKSTCNELLILKQFFGLVALVFLGVILFLSIGWIGLILSIFIAPILICFILFILNFISYMFYGLFMAPIQIGHEVVTILKADIQIRNNPNQGVWNSLKNSVAIGIVFLAFISVFWIIPYRISLLPLPFNLVIFLSMVINVLCLGAFAIGGGAACLYHLCLRLTLYHTKQAPWDFAAFFKQAEDRLFIYRTGGSYVFVHRYLQEHFANLSFDET